MATNAVSSSRLYVNDVLVTRGQLGFGYSATVSADTTLWGIYPGANKYALNINAAGVDITLPAVSTALADAQPGHSIVITNTNVTNSVAIRNSVATLVVTIEPSAAAMIVADTAQATGWYVVFNTGDYFPDTTTLQNAYDNSGATDPQIQLSAAFGGLKIQDAVSGSNLASIFRLRNDLDTYTYFNVGNATPGSQTPFATLLDGTVTGTNSIAVSGSTSGTNSVVLTPGNAFTNNTSNMLTKLFTAGEASLGGTIPVGTTLTSPNRYIAWYSAAGVVPNANTTISLGTLSDDTTYDFELKIYGRDDTNPTNTSVTHRLTALVSRTGAALTIFGTQLTSIETPGYTTFFSDCSLADGGAGVLNLLVNATDAGGTASMEFRVASYYSALTI